MSRHPVIPEQLDNEDWLDWFTRTQDAILAAPPAAPDGFLLLPCSAMPRHSPTYVIDDGETADYASCWQCQYAALADEHRPCEHKQHGAWRHWKSSKKVASWLYTLGILRGFGTTHSSDCPGCLIRIRWSLFRGPYVLFVRRETWRCWRAGHRRGDQLDFGYCAKCVPWYCCGSTKRGHAEGCGDDPVSTLDQIIGVCFRCQHRPAPDASLYCTTCRPIVDANPAEPIETADWTDELGLARQGKRGGDQ